MNYPQKTDTGLYQEYLFTIWVKGTYDFTYCRYDELRKHYKQLQKRYPYKRIAVRRFAAVLDVDMQEILREKERTGRVMTVAEITQEKIAKLER
jgi:hypothetical protein